MKIKNLLFSIPLVLGGCGLMPHKALQLYEGTEKYLSEVASIAEGRRVWGYITKIDSEWIVDPLIGGGRFTKGIHILPGKHVFHWKYTTFKGSGLGIAKGSFTYIVEAGHSYIPVFLPSLDGSHVQVKLIDKGKNYNQECLKDTVLAKYESAENC